MSVVTEEATAEQSYRPSSTGFGPGATRTPATSVGPSPARSFVPADVLRGRVGVASPSEAEGISTAITAQPGDPLPRPAPALQQPPDARSLANSAAQSQKAPRSRRLSAGKDESAPRRRRVRKGGGARAAFGGSPQPAIASITAVSHTQQTALPAATPPGPPQHQQQQIPGSAPAGRSPPLALDDLRAPPASGSDQGPWPAAAAAVSVAQSPSSTPSEPMEPPRLGSAPQRGSDNGEGVVAHSPKRIERGRTRAPAPTRVHAADSTAQARRPSARQQAAAQSSFQRRAAVALAKHTARAGQARNGTAAAHAVAPSTQARLVGGSSSSATASRLTRDSDSSSVRKAVRKGYVAGRRLAKRAQARSQRLQRRPVLKAAVTDGGWD